MCFFMFHIHISPAFSFVFPNISYIYRSMYIKKRCSTFFCYLRSYYDLLTAASEEGPDTTNMLRNMQLRRAARTRQANISSKCRGRTAPHLSSKPPRPAPPGSSGSESGARSACSPRFEKSRRPLLPEEAAPCCLKTARPFVPRIEQLVSPSAGGGTPPGDW